MFYYRSREILHMDKYSDDQVNVEVIKDVRNEALCLPSTLEKI